MTHVEGKKVGDIMMFALSTCIWCRKTKTFLNSLGVDYNYTDVDLLEGDEKDKAIETITKWNPACSFPTIIINNKECIVGYDEEKIRKALRQ